MDNVTSPAVNEVPTQDATQAAAAPVAAATPAPTQSPADMGQASLPPELAADKARVDAAVADYQKTAAAPLTPAHVPGAVGPNTPHGRLISMIQGLTLGADAFGKSIATHGREGGVQEVEQAQQQQQDMQVKAQQAAQAQRNSELQQKITTAQTNEQLMQAHIMLARLPQQISLENLQTKTANLDYQNKIQQTQIQLADFEKQNWGLTPAQIAGTAPGTPANLNQSKTMLGRALPNAQLILGADAPAVAAVNAILKSDNPTVQDIMAAGQGLQTALDQKAQLISAQTKAADLETAQTKAKFAGPEAEANIASAKARQASAETSQAKGTFELGQEKREASNITKPDIVGFTPNLTPKEYDKRYDAFTKSKQYTNLQTAQGSKQQFDDIIDKMNKGDFSGAASVVGLFDALGISVTPLQGKGMRINRDVINEHIDARGLDQSLYQKLLSLKNGDVITPKQLRDYAGIADGVLYHGYVNAADEAHREGLPVDFLPQGGGHPVDPATAQIYTDTVLHSNPNLARDPQALKAAIAKAIQSNGWLIK